VTLTLPRLQITEPIVDDKGRPTKAYQKRWADAMSGVETQVNGVQDALDAIELLQIQQDAFNIAISNLIITYDGIIAGIIARLDAAGI
jgi:hypothetical protein